MTPPPRVLPAGEAALVFEFGASADPAFHDQVLALDAALAERPLAGVLETVPTYRSLMVHFDPLRLDRAALVAHVEAIDLSSIGRPAPRRWRIPVCYDGEHGEDLVELSGRLGMDTETIARLHATATYRVVMYGFAPGFVFLSGLPDALTVSRRPTPRPPAKPGALTIANGQALIASVAMPTGWYVLGRTPIRTFDPSAAPPSPFAVGDRLHLERVDAARFAVLHRDAEDGHLVPVVEPCC